MQLSPSEFWDMTPREFFAGIHGKHRSDRNIIEAIRSIIYDSQRFNATGIAGALSREQAKSLRRYKFPWEKGYFERTPRGNISYDDAKGIFNLMSVEKGEA